MQDITYLPCLEGTLYLNSISDLYNAEIVAYAVSRHPDTRLCLDSLQMLVDALGGNVKGIILHSDCGSTYTSNAYRSRLEELGIRMSLGSKASQQASKLRLSARWAPATTTRGWNPSTESSRRKRSTAPSGSLR